MKLQIYCLFTFILFAGSCARQSKNTDNNKQVVAVENQLYSTKAKEKKIYFDAYYLTSGSAEKNLPNESTLLREIQELNKYLFGPLTYRQIGAPQKDQQIKIDFNQTRNINGKIAVLYRYSATWLIADEYSDQNIVIPVPYSQSALKTTNWTNCTDSDLDHRTWSFFWYFWDPSRPQCDHQLGREYQNIRVQTEIETPQTKKTYPEYNRMIRIINGQPVLEMTFAFGYVQDPLIYQPFLDSDYGMRQFRLFYNQVKRNLKTQGFTEKPILRSSYDNSSDNTVIGAQFIGSIQSIEYHISLVASAGVDQMDLFSKSFAQNHEAFFGWFGHSRVGSGFDADILKMNIRRRPDLFQITTDYQLVYWAGCNSYSYYTLPFFKMKSQVALGSDASGTKNLDIISNGLPSLFSFNAANALIAFDALIDPSKQISYQEIVDKIERFAEKNGSLVLVNVLGDEDNL